MGTLCIHKKSSKKQPQIYRILSQNIFQISPTFQKVFNNKPMITYKRNKSLGELIGSHNLQRGKYFKTKLKVNQNHTQRVNHLYAVHK